MGLEFEQLSMSSATGRMPACSSKWCHQGEQLLPLWASWLIQSHTPSFSRARREIAHEPRFPAPVFEIGFLCHFLHDSDLVCRLSRKRAIASLFSGVMLSLLVFPATVRCQIKVQVLVPESPYCTKKNQSIQSWCACHPCHTLFSEDHLWSFQICLLLLSCVVLLNGWNHCAAVFIASFSDLQWHVWFRKRRIQRQNWPPFGRQRTWRFCNPLIIGWPKRMLLRCFR